MAQQLVLSAVLIVVTMVMLDWLESVRARMTLVRRQRREQLGKGSAMRVPEHVPTRHYRHPAAKKETA